MLWSLPARLVAHRDLGDMSDSLASRLRPNMIGLLAFSQLQNVSTTMTFSLCSLYAITQGTIEKHTP